MKSLKMEASLTGAYAPLPTPAARQSPHNRRWGGLDPCTSSQPLDPTAPPFIPRQRVASAGLAYQTHRVEDFARYLARHELASTGLTQFNDRPESYRAWQSSFMIAITDLDLCASKELDLLVKWLGRESVEHAKRMRTVHINNPEAALKKAWARLNKCYASPEVIECALYRKLDRFPKISNKDYIKLGELGDLLMELQSAKEDGYLLGLAYLNTACSIDPIVEKLPYGLQEKWVSHGSRYKDGHRGYFPPFSHFTEFICYEACTRNDPSFALLVNSAAPERIEKSGSRYPPPKTPISIHKTDVSAAEDPGGSTIRRKSPGPGKICPIHNKLHLLRRCRGFRAKPRGKNGLSQREWNMRLQDNGEVW